MYDYHKIKTMLCDEVDGIAREGEMTPSTLDTLHKAIGTIKNIKKIEMLDEVSDYGEYEERKSRAYRGSYRGGSYDGGSSYRRGRDSMGRYTRDSGNFRGYSRAEVKSSISEEIESLMHDATNDNERQALQRALESVQNA